MWEVHSWSRTLPEGQAVQLPDLRGGCNEPVLLMLAGAPERLFLAEAFGFKVDRRRSCEEAAHGGIYAIEPSSGRVEYRIAEHVFVNRMAAAAGGRELYVLDSFGPNEREGVRLLRLDAWTGRILASRESQPGVWNLALAKIPAALIPHSGVRPDGCQH
jgi:hypothetical protein